MADVLIWSAKWAKKIKKNNNNKVKNVQKHKSSHC